ncbi:MAG: TauD/TfdA family dioxygenase [Alphaproteobacteria bacterium]|nr:TauD/TfdA family dioxygenase [Alphaproteobacteria bacterium]
MHAAEASVLEAPAATAVTVIPLGAALGAEVKGVDVADGIGEAQFQAVRDALHRHAVIVLRNQHLSPADQIAFSKRLGPMRISFYNRYAVPDHPELTVVSNIVEDGRAIGIADAGMLWHTDASYLRQPDMYTLLYSLEIPHEGGKAIGDTMFVNAAAAYEALPDADKRALEGVRAVHSFTHHLEKKRLLGNLKRAPLTEAQKKETPDVDHPVVRTHPVTGRKCLFVTEGHTASIVGLPEDESAALLERLWAHLKNPAFIYRHNWRVGDLVVWDNCTAHHLAVFDYGDRRRRLYRAGIAGEVPV